MSKEINDGWEGKAIEQLKKDFVLLEGDMYEIRMCVRGCETGCTTKAELAQFLRERIEVLQDDIDQLENEED